MVAALLHADGSDSLGNNGPKQLMKKMESVFCSCDFTGEHHVHRWINSSKRRQWLSDIILLSLIWKSHRLQNQIKHRLCINWTISKQKGNTYVRYISLSEFNIHSRMWIVCKWFATQRRRLWCQRIWIGIANVSMIHAHLFMRNITNSLN